MVPRTVGNLRREGCQVPSGQRICGPAIPQRSCASAKATRVATAPGFAIASGLTFSRYSPLVAAMPRLTFAASESGRGFSSTRTPSGTSAAEPGRFATTTASSTWGRSAGSDRARSASCPCETTTAETFTPRVSPCTRRASARRSPAS